VTVSAVVHSLRGAPFSLPYSTRLDRRRPRMYFKHMFETDDYIADNPDASPSETGSTRDAILAAALRILARDGYTALTARAVAAEAGTNVALLNYYFGSKRKFLPELFDAIDASKLARQREMYAAPAAPLSAKWREAVSFYRQDLADGYVRVLHELYALGYTNPEVAARIQGRLNNWRALLEEVARGYLPALGIGLPPELVASAVASFWLGMEVQHLAGASEDDGQFFAILDAIGDWLEAREAEMDATPADQGDAAETHTD
jgi:AcrR family transcriptional regulator